MGLFILIVLACLLVGTLPAWEYSSKWSRWPSRVLGVVLFVGVVLVQLDYMPMVL